MIRAFGLAFSSFVCLYLEQRNGQTLCAMSEKTIEAQSEGSDYEVICFGFNLNTPKNGLSADWLSARWLSANEIKVYCKTIH